MGFQDHCDTCPVDRCLFKREDSLHKTKVYFIHGALYPTCQTVVSLEGRRNRSDFINNINNENMNATLS